MLKRTGSILHSRFSFVLAAVLATLLCGGYGYYLSLFAQPPEDGYVDYSPAPDGGDGGWASRVLTESEEGAAVFTPEDAGASGAAEEGKVVRMERTLTERVDSPTLRITTFLPHIEVYVGDTLVCESDAPESAGADLTPRDLIVTLPEDYLGQTLGVVLFIPPWAETEYDEDIYGPMFGVELYAYQTLYANIATREVGISFSVISAFAAAVFCFLLFLVQVYRKKSALPMLFLALVALFWSYSSSIWWGLSWNILPQGILDFASLVTSGLRYLPLFLLLCYFLKRKRRAMILLTAVYAAFELVFMLYPAVCPALDVFALHSQLLFLIVAFLFICLEYGKKKGAVLLKAAFTACALLYCVYLSVYFAYGTGSPPMETADPAADLMEKLLYAGILFGSISVMAYRVVKDIVAANVRAGMLETRQEETLKSYKALLEYTGQVAVIRHDIKNHLAALGYILEQGDRERALEYLGELTKQDGGVMSVALTDNLPVNTILNDKLGECRGLGIAADMGGVSVPEKLPFSDNDLVAVLGNLLDNAIAAAGGAVDGDRFITLEMHVKNNNLYIGMRNGMVADGRSTDKKSRMHGYGLAIIRRIAEKYSGMTQFERKGTVFYSTVVLHMDGGAEGGA